MEFFKHSANLETRFVDMDAFGHINNANFLTYLEEARIKYLDDIIGWKYNWSKEAIILARAEIDFRIPAMYKDRLKMYTRCIHLGNKSFTLEYKLIKVADEKEILLAAAKTVLVMFNYEKNFSIPVPENWKVVIREYEGEINQQIG